MERVKALIRDVPDFPKKGIVFKDITPVLADGAAFLQVVKALAEPFRELKFRKVVGMEARGFIFGAAVAAELEAGFIPVRKPGKLPYRTRDVHYELEYGTDALEMHEDAIDEGEAVLVVDDLLATGGTAAATKELIEKLGGRATHFAFMIELDFLDGRKRLGDASVTSLIHY